MIPPLSFTGTGGAAYGGTADNHSTVVLSGDRANPFSIERLISATQGSEYNGGFTDMGGPADIISRTTGSLKQYIPWIVAGGLVLVGIVVWRKYR